MKHLGVVSLGHDASVALIEDDKILFAAHSERYSRVKNDGNINSALLEDAFQYGTPDAIVWYEKPWLKKARMVMAGQENLFSNPFKVKYHLGDFGLSHLPFHKVSHHESHAAAGYYTSKFDDASILVSDAIGEFTTISIWKAKFGKMEKVWSQSYPDSLGLLYSAMTQRVGLKPNEEEYILMGMAALGDRHRLFGELCDEFLDEGFTYPSFKLNHNVHRGAKWWLKDELKTQQDMYDVAAAMQYLAEIQMVGTCKWISDNLPSKNLILMGGVALNCKANTEIADDLVNGVHFDNIWIMPNPGDAGSSIGAVAAHTKTRLDWQGPYLGYNIEGEFDYEGALNALLGGEIIGVAHGRAEFGPRALGNRSLIADPRGADVKDKVNSIKKREMFRPFAPVILEHLAHEYFDMPVDTAPYMQFTAACKRPDLFPAICHFDNTSRVQTINREQNPRFYKLIEMFYEKTGCPMVLNTSLNIKGQPLVNDWQDALNFSEMYGVKVF